MSIKPKLSTFDTTMIVVSLVIGIGIFRTPSMVATATGSTELFFTAWILGGIISLFGALTFAEIGSRFPSAGGFYQVVAHCYRSDIAFMFNWTNVMLVNPASGAGVAMIGAEYILPLFMPKESITPIVIQLTSSGVVIFLLLINYLGIKTGAWAQNILSMLKIFMILIFALIALTVKGNSFSTDVLPPAASVNLISALGISLISIIFSYGGYQMVINFGEDVKNAKKKIPIAIFMGIAIVILCYLSINFAYYKVLGFSELANSKLVAADVAKIVFGNSGYMLISAAIFLSAIGFLNAILLQVPRSYYAMAEDKTLPKIFGKVNSKTQTQEFGLVFFGIVILLMINLLGTFEKIVNYVMFFDAANIALVASTIFILRKKSPADYDGYKIPLFPVLPVIFILFLLFVSYSVFASEVESALIGLLIFAVGYPVFLLMRKFNPS
jgi:APA family basic amino acid/polyamine antiporter